MGRIPLAGSDKPTKAIGGYKPLALTLTVVIVIIPSRNANNRGMYYYTLHSERRSCANVGQYQ